MLYFMLNNGATARDLTTKPSATRLFQEAYFLNVGDIIILSDAVKLQRKLSRMYRSFQSSDVSERQVRAGARELGGLRRQQVLEEARRGRRGGRVRRQGLSGRAEQHEVIILTQA